MVKPVSRKGRYLCVCLERKKLIVSIGCSAAPEEFGIRTELRQRRGRQKMHLVRAAVPSQTLHQYARPSSSPRFSPSVHKCSLRFMFPPMCSEIFSVDRAPLNPAHGHVRRRMPAAAGRVLHRDHVALVRNLDRLRLIADALDDVSPESATSLIMEANTIVQEHVVEHERDDEGSVYPRLAKILMDGHGLSAMSRAHREILHLARLLARVVEDLPSEMIDRYLVRDAQRVIEAIEALVRIHTAQEEDIYDAVVAQ